MPIPVTWSERNEPNTIDHSWRDCTYCAALMAIVYGGKWRFPHGSYSVDERELLERSDTQPDETGASLDDVRLACHNRYGIDLGPTKHIADLPAALATHQVALVLQGSNKNLPVGDPWRRWDPASVANHCVCIVTGNPDKGSVRLLDPEATWKFKGDTVPASKVLTWAKGLGDFIVVPYNSVPLAKR